MTWGKWGNEFPCEHLLALRQVIENNDLAVYAELATDPQGWVNVHCSRCKRTYEVTLQEPWATE